MPTLSKVKNFTDCENKCTIKVLDVNLFLVIINTQNILCRMPDTKFNDSEIWR